MTARQRIECTLRGELPDRVPVFDLIQHIPLIEYTTGEKVTLQNGLDLLCKTIGERLDITRGIAPPVEEKLVRHEDGFEMRKRFGANIRTAFLPILMLTANADEQSRSQGFLVGTDDYMAKPVSIPELHTRVTRLLPRTYGL